MPAIRTSDLSLSIISDIVRNEIDSSLKTDDDYNNALKIIREKQDIIIKNTEQHLKKELVDFIPNLKSIEIEDRKNKGYFYQNMYLRLSNINVNDGVNTALDYKGDGLKI